MENETNNQAAKMATEQFKPWTGASVEVIAQFLSDLAAAQAAAPRVHLDKNRFWGKTADEMMVYTQSLNTTDKKRAGVKALKAKYGHEAAASIVKNHSGRNIR